MSIAPATPPYSASWKWWVSGLLLLATMINYMDRQTLANLSVRITDEFGLSQEQYGDIELVFGWGFAIGSLTFGILADRINVRVLYPVVLLGWSAVGFATGLSRGHGSLLACRAILGFFEAGHWPCALRTTQSTLSANDRLMGNSVLQSGASLGAIVTPLAIRAIVGGNTAPGVWRLPFFVVGAAGAVWVIAWLALVRRGDLKMGGQTTGDDSPGRGAWWTRLAGDRRFWALVIMVVCINSVWQLIRAWLPKFLQQGRGYDEATMLYFNSAYYVATDVGCLLAGALGLWLARHGFQPHRARLLVFGLCSILAALTTVAAALPRGWPLLGVLLIIGAGTLGLFPCYYSFTQEMGRQHVGKATGLLATIAWVASAPLQKFFGRLVDQTGSFDLGLAVIGWTPCVALGAMLLLWRHGEAQDAETA
jgi:ACS family hexuronate transporter-like MFS transporter